MQRERMGTIGPSLLEVLGSLTDPRSPHGKRHPLGAILGLAVCAMLSGARSLYAISQWGRDQGLEVSQALGFTRERTPCVSTLHQVFSRLAGSVTWHPELTEQQQLLLCDAQTSGGLLISVPRDRLDGLLSELHSVSVAAAVIGEITEGPVGQIQVLP